MHSHARENNKADIHATSEGRKQEMNSSHSKVLWMAEHSKGRIKGHEHSLDIYFLGKQNSTMSTSQFKQWQIYKVQIKKNEKDYEPMTK